MPDDGFADALSLRLRGPAFIEQVQGEEAAVELEGHVGGFEVGGGCADVVEEAGQEVRFCRGREVLEVLLY